MAAWKSEQHLPVSVQGIEMESVEPLLDEEVAKAQGGTPARSPTAEQLRRERLLDLGE